MKKFDYYIKLVGASLPSDDYINDLARAVLNDVSHIKVKGGHRRKAVLKISGKVPYFEVTDNGSLEANVGIALDANLYGINEEYLVEINRQAEKLFDEHQSNFLKDESALGGVIASVMGGYGGDEFYPGMIRKAAQTWCKLATLQAFSNGNKRTALLAALYILDANGFIWRNPNGNELYDLTTSVARRDEGKDAAYLEKIIRRNVIVRQFSSLRLAKEFRGGPITMNVRVDKPKPL